MNISVDLLAWEMAQWELHLLRGMLGVLVIRTQMFARDHSDSRDAAELSDQAVNLMRTLAVMQLEALTDPTKRGLRPTVEGQ